MTTRTIELPPPDMPDRPGLVYDVFVPGATLQAVPVTVAAPEGYGIVNSQPVLRYDRLYVGQLYTVARSPRDQP